MDDAHVLWKLIFANIGYSTLLVAHDLELFPLLGERPRTDAEVREALGIAERPAAVLLATCVALGLARVSDGRYALTPVAERTLLPGSETYFGSFLDAMVANDAVFTFDAMKRAVLADSAQVYGGEALFEEHEQQAGLAQAFTRAMHGHSAEPARAWPPLIDLGDARTLLDVGGGSGAHAIAAALRWPRLSAVVFDIPVVCAVADQYVARQGLCDRVGTLAGDMWKDPFPPADVHFYADIFHDWPDAKCRFLAEKSFASLPRNGRIVVHELLFDDDKTGPLAAAAYSGAMLLWTEGRQRSGREISALLAEAGFTDVAVQPTIGYWSVVTARRP